MSDFPGVNEGKRKGPKRSYGEMSERGKRIVGSRTALITGGVGFIGTNLAHRLAMSGRSVLLFDNMSRDGVEKNLLWLQKVHGDRVRIRIADVRDRHALRLALQNADEVFHLAAQVAVTKSLVDPIHDFEVNVQGTVNLLEELRLLEHPPPLVFTSTNKVYGSLEDIKLQRDGTRYEPVEYHTRSHGIGEDRSLEFHSPYGCSKGAADQYVIDYTRTFRLPAVVFRMSCIYGPHQMGTEDQGWVAHFLIQAIQNRPITIYGDGMQVRDVLFIDDLIDAFLLAQENISTLSGQSFNIGGGPQNTLSLVELLDFIRDIHGKKPNAWFADWRPGDQRYYVSDWRKFQAATGWAPRVRTVEGLVKLYAWLVRCSSASAEVFQQTVSA